MKQSNKFFIIALALSIFFHIVLIIGLQLPNIKTQNVDFTPVEVVLEPSAEPVAAPIPNETEKEQIPPKEDEPKIIAADKADKDHDSSTKAEKTKTQNKILTHKQSVQTQKGHSDKIDLGSSIVGPIDRANKKPTNITQEQKDTLAKRGDKEGSSIESGSPTSNNERSSKGESTQKQNKTNTGSPDKTDTQTTVAKKERLTAQEITAAGGRIQPRDGVVVPFPKRSAEIRYKGIVPSTMTFTRTGSSYTIIAKVNVPFKKMVFISKGTIEGNKFRPTSYSDTRGGKLYSSAEFDYENKVIYYGKEKGSTKEEPMGDNPLDTFSAAWQLAMNQGRVSGPLQVSSGKGIKTYQPSELNAQSGDYNQGEGKLRVKRLTIPASNKTSYGLATDFGFFPATITYDGYELYVDKFILDGVDYWQAQNKVGKKQ